MGEIAEMMLDGTLCEGCGGFLNEHPPGYPCRCNDCKRQDIQSTRKPAKVGSLQKQERVKCTCGRCITPRGMQKHIHDFHNKKVAP